MRRNLSFWLVGLFILAVGIRIAAPSTLYDNDQPKTVAYTIDMLNHGRWALPVDMLGRQATKPPMYNWIGVPFVAVFGPSEWTLKAPALLAAAVTLLLLILAGSKLASAEVGLLACCLWLASDMGMKMIYLARPDGVLAAFMIGAWWCATVAMGKSPSALQADSNSETGDPAGHDGSVAPRGPALPALGFWLCVAGAALAKGPAAIICLIYIPLAAKLIHGRWCTAARLRWAWGLPLMLALVAGWLLAAYLSNPAGFWHYLMGDLTKVGQKHSILGDILASLWMMPLQFIARFAPASILAILWLIDTRPRPRAWFKSPLAPAALWMLLVVVVFSFFPRHRPDYLLPACGPAALLAAAKLRDIAAEFRFSLHYAAGACLVIILGLSSFYFVFNRAAKSGYGRHVTQFVAQVRHIIGDAPVACIDTGYNPLEPLLGVNDPPKSPMTGVQWIIRPVAGETDPVIKSQPLSQVFGYKPGVVGLYHQTDALAVKENGGEARR